jgi:hypothetical protein
LHNTYEVNNLVGAGLQRCFNYREVGCQKCGNIAKNCSLSIVMNALRAIGYCGDSLSIDMNALQAIAEISHKEIMSIERIRCKYCFVRRTLTTKSERKYFNNAHNLLHPSSKDGLIIHHSSREALFAS